MLPGVQFKICFHQPSLGVSRSILVKRQYVDSICNHSNVVSVYSIRQHQVYRRHDFVSWGSWLLLAQAAVKWLCVQHDAPCMYAQMVQVHFSVSSGQKENLELIEDFTDKFKAPLDLASSNISDLLVLCVCERAHQELTARQPLLLYQR